MAEHCVSARGSIMKIFLKKNKFHLLLIALMLIFFFVSPLVQQKIVLKNSSIKELTQPIPPTVSNAHMHIDSLRLKQVQDEMYDLSGWGFMILDTKLGPEDYQRSILLSTQTHTFEIPIKDVERKDVLETFADLDLPILKAGFIAEFPKNALPNGEYTISFLFTLPDNTQQRFDSIFSIIKSFNKIELRAKHD